MQQADDQLIYKSKRFQVVRRTYSLQDGSIHEKDTIQHPGAVAIIPCVDEDHICLIRNNRIAVQKTMIEIPAGTLEGENPLVTAHKELIEETGFTADVMDDFGYLSMSPGILNERMNLFIAKDLKKGEQKLEVGEEIEILILHHNEIKEQLKNGQIEDAKTVAALLKFFTFASS